MPSVRSILVIYLGKKRWLWSDVSGKSFRDFLGGEIWHVFWVRFDFNLQLQICFWLYACSGSSLGGVACFAYAICSIEGSNGAGFSETNSNQPSKEGNVTPKEKPLRPPRNFNFVHLQRMVAYLTFWFCSKTTWQKSQLSLYLVTRNCCNRQLVCYFAWMITSFYWTVISAQHYRCWVGKITTQEKKSQRYTNADLKISLYVYVHIKTIPWEFRVLNP